MAERKTASLWLGLLSFAEASFFPIPPDVLLIPLCLGAIRKALKFALICSVASVLGGLAGYAIGVFGWEALQQVFYEYVPGFTEEKFTLISEWFDEWGVALVLIAGFSPIPYKIFTISAGVVVLNFPGFVIASLIGRGARFFLVTSLVVTGGQRMEEMILKYVERIGWAVVAIVFAIGLGITWEG